MAPVVCDDFRSAKFCDTDARVHGTQVAKVKGQVGGELERDGSGVQRLRRWRCWRRGEKGSNERRRW